MIVLVTGKIEPWLTYIWEQFVRINSLFGEYRLLSYAEYRSPLVPECIPLIEYGVTQRFPHSLFIPCRKRYRTDDYLWIHDDLPVFRDTVAENGGEREYDFFYNAFVHLSRLEEWEAEKSGRRIRSYSRHHPRKDGRVWRIPVVNYLFNELECRIKEKFPPVEFGGGAKPFIEFSHDVDYVEKTVPLRIKQTLFDFFNGARCLMGLEFRKGASKLRGGIAFAFGQCDYWCFDEWDAMERMLDIKSVYYIFAKVDRQRGFDLKRWLLDPSYNIAENGRLRMKCGELIGRGNGIGLHGSYYSAEDEELFIREKEMLENLLDYEITKTRQHWLNYREGTTPYIHGRAGIKEDSSVGFNDITCFRAGVASLYNPYDHRNEVSFPFTEMPFVVMDSHLYDYAARGWVQFPGWLFQSMDRIKNFAVAIDWHQRVISRDYGWDEAYKEIAERYWRGENTDLAGKIPERMVHV